MVVIVGRSGLMAAAPSNCLTRARRSWLRAELFDKFFSAERVLRGLFERGFAAHAEFPTADLDRFAGPATDNEVQRRFFLDGPGILPEAAELGV